MLPWSGFLVAPDVGSLYNGAMYPRIAILPTLLTLGNGICGYVAITYASKVMPTEKPESIDHYFAMAGWFIIFAMLFDLLDGYVARRTRTASKFGGELDSLCDAISFGVAPAFLALKLGPGWESVFLHRLLAGITALYLACTVLRLARFNVDNNPDPAFHKRFRGLPSPAAAGCLSSLAICRGEFPAQLTIYFNDTLSLEAARHGVASAIEILAPVGALLVALLMVSNVAYPHASSRLFRGRRHVGHLVQILLAGLILLMLRQIAPALVFWVYALLFPLRGLVMKGLAVEPTPRLDEPTSH
jgi:CDP-diacylglycerol---serine O-phosphatidyltransferase